MTETWYENMGEDEARQASSLLNTYEYRLMVKNRKEGRGGGIALVARREYGVYAKRQLIPYTLNHRYGKCKLAKPFIGQ